MKNQCTCTKDCEMTCIVHPLEFEKIRVMAKHIAELKATIAELEKDRDIALAESYRCGYEAAKMEGKADE